MATSYIELGASTDDLLDRSKNPGMRIVTVDKRSGASLTSVLNAIAAEFPTDYYPVLTNGNRELFRDILAEWMLNNWETWLEIELLLTERDCREQLTLLHDVAASFDYAWEAAVYERINRGLIEKYPGNTLGNFVLRTYVF